MDLSGTQRAPSGGAASPHLLEYIEQWLARRWVPIVINLAALALLSYSLARGTWRLFTPPVVDGPPTGAINEASDNFDLQALLAANVFGQTNAATKESDPRDAPLSSLNLVLTGVMITPAGNFALISADGGPETPFGTGQEIVGGVSLYAVYPDRALIRRGGATESLMLKDNSSALPSGSIIAPSAVPGSRASRRRRNRALDGIQQQSANSFSVDREQLTEQMQTPEFLTQALMVPNAGGGFLVREINPGSVYEKLGLRVGDVINSVNGQPVNTVDDVMRLYQQFGNTGNIQVNVRRAGRNETLVYNIQ